MCRAKVESLLCLKHSLEDHFTFSYLIQHHSYPPKYRVRVLLEALSNWLAFAFEGEVCFIDTGKGPDASQHSTGLHQRLVDHQIASIWRHSFTNDNMSQPYTPRRLPLGLRSSLGNTPRSSLTVTSNNNHKQQNYSPEPYTATGAGHADVNHRLVNNTTARESADTSSARRGSRQLSGASDSIMESYQDAGLEVGDVVEVPGGMTGTVQYIGPVKAKKGIFAGVELSKEFAARGKNDGDVEG